MRQAEFQTARAHEEPFARQFSIFMPNRVGQFGEVLDALGEAELSIAGLSVVDATDWAVVRLIFADANTARNVLEKKGFSFTESDVLLVELPDDEALRQLFHHLVRAEINVQLTFSLMMQSRDRAVMALRVDDMHIATETLTRHGYTLLGLEDLSDPGGAL